MNSLEQRVQALEDIEEIKKLKARWWFACDARDPVAMRACFQEDDFLIDFGFIGRYDEMDEFIKVFQDLTSSSAQIDMHHGMAPEIELTGPDSATGRWRMRFQLLETEKKLVQLMSGYYEDKYVKKDGEWRMSLSKYTIMSNLLLRVEEGTLGLLEMGCMPGLVTQERG